MDTIYKDQTLRFVPRPREDTREGYKIEWKNEIKRETRNRREVGGAREMI
jgi:hypothetical protein